MAEVNDVEVEGVTEFYANPKTLSYRYVLKLKNNKMSIWMEDRASKKQWRKSELCKADYVTSANVISDASEIYYPKCFQDSLDSEEMDESDDDQRTLKVVEGGALQLTFYVKIRVHSSERIVKYAFVLDPVKVDRIDVLESKLKDQQDELEQLRKELKFRGNLRPKQF